MRVALAGYNVDSRVLREAEEAGVSPERLTPEVLSAAYARISRDPRPASELREAALAEVEKARASNRKIIFQMGHHSVAEHAVFNFDIIGISRLAIETLERFRLCSFTEKSQRYITLDHDFVLPQEVRGTAQEAEFLSLITAQSELYKSLNGALRERLESRHPELQKKRSGRKLLEGWAKEDARYVTLMATSGQLGLTANARNLELMVRRMAAAPLAEIRELGELLYNTASAVAPSLLLFTEPSAYDRETLPAVEAIAGPLLPEGEAQTDPPSAHLLHATPEADLQVAAGLLHTATGREHGACREAVDGMSAAQLRGLFEETLSRMEFFDSTPREFEHVSLTFEVCISSSCYAQLKRHRMSTQTMQQYDPDLGVTVPPGVREIGMEQEFLDHAERSSKLARAIETACPAASPYALTNAHRRRLLLTTNLRELYHIVRLREDKHAQWDIRNLARELRREAEGVMPLGALLLSGKDGFVDRYREVYGRAPAIDPADLDP